MKYNLSITRDYVSNWGAVQAVRELIQNAIDSEAPFCYEFTDDTLILYSANTILQPKTLLLGTTTKDSTNIGSFGEGYKLAMLVLTRLDYSLEIYNGRNMWIPQFEHDSRFDSEILVIEETPMTVSNEGLSFVVHDLSQQDIDDIRSSCLMMQHNIGRITSTRYGDILHERPGKLYVGGLFICDTQLKFGYNIKPEFMALERDRQTVSQWNLHCMTRDMWYDTKDYDTVAELIESKIPDLAYAEFSSPEMVKEACYKLFRDKCPKGVITDNRKDMEKMIKDGLTVHIYHEAFYNAVRGSTGYKSQAPKIKTTTPHDELEAWYAKAKYHMHDKIKKSFRQLMEDAKKWRN